MLCDSLYLASAPRQVDPSSAATFQAFAIALSDQGRTDQARDLFRRGCEAQPNLPYLYHAWARMEEQVGNHELARSLFALGFKAAPESTAMLRSWSEMVSRERRPGHKGSPTET